MRPSEISISVVENGYIIRRGGSVFVFGNLSSALAWIDDHFEPKKEDPSK